MFVVLLRFGENKVLAPKFMEDHKDWIKQGVADNVFMLVGSLQPNQGGAILAHNITKEELDLRVDKDPFVAQGVVRVEILEISPHQTIDQLNFLTEQAN